MSSVLSLHSGPILNVALNDSKRSPLRIKCRLTLVSLSRSGLGRDLVGGTSRA